MRKLVIDIVFTIVSLQSLSQKSGSIKGMIYDTAKNEPVTGATITVMKKKDSSLVSFTMVDNKGRFQLDLDNGEYRMLVTHVNYHTTSRIFTLDNNNKTLDFGNIFVTNKNT